METTLTAFQREFAKARKAADRGETVSIKADDESRIPGTDGNRPGSAEEFARVFDELETLAPAMDLADGCLLNLQRRIPASIIVTTDHRDFATYRVPFVSPIGVFAR